MAPSELLTKLYEVKTSLAYCMNYRCFCCPYRQYKNDIYNCRWHLENDSIQLLELFEKQLSEYEKYRENI